MTDTNYNDGKWHGWQGGKRPIPNDAKFHCVFAHGQVRMSARNLAEECWEWVEPWHQIVAFCVVKEPRDFWVVLEDRTMWNSEFYADEHNEKTFSGKSVVIHVREVIGDDT